MNTKQNEIIKKLAQLGDVALVKADGSRHILNEEGKIPLQTHKDAVLYNFERMDSEMLSLILDDNQTFQNFDKKTFLKKLDDVFDVFLTRGNVLL
jgi:hypothetical protein